MQIAAYPYGQLEKALAKQTAGHFQAQVDFHYFESDSNSVSNLSN